MSEYEEREPLAVENTIFECPHCGTENALDWEIEEAFETTSLHTCGQCGHDFVFDVAAEIEINVTVNNIRKVNKRRK